MKFLMTLICLLGSFNAFCDVNVFWHTDQKIVMTLKGPDAENLDSLLLPETIIARDASATLKYFRLSTEEFSIACKKSAQVELSSCVIDMHYSPNLIFNEKNKSLQFVLSLPEHIEEVFQVLVKNQDETVPRYQSQNLFLTIGASKQSFRVLYQGK